MLSQYLSAMYIGWPIFTECDLRFLGPDEVRYTWILASKFLLKMFMEKTVCTIRKPNRQIVAISDRSQSYTESKNGWGWKRPLEVIWSNYPAQAGSSRASCPGPCPNSFEYLQGWRLHVVYGQPAPLLSHPHSQKVVFWCVHSLLHKIRTFELLMLPPHHCQKTQHGYIESTRVCMLALESFYECQKSSLLLSWVPWHSAQGMILKIWARTKPLAVSAKIVKYIFTCISFPESTVGELLSGFHGNTPVNV